MMCNLIYLFEKCSGLSIFFGLSFFKLLRIFKITLFYKNKNPKHVLVDLV